MTSVPSNYDHYIYRAHMRRWATDNRVAVLRRGEVAARTLEVGKHVAAERGLNDPLIEAAYGKVEDAFNRAMRRLLDSLKPLTDRNRQAIREYSVLMHDRYPGLRGSAVDEHGLPGGNAMMVPNPAHWGAMSGVSDSLGHLATTMPREQLKAARLQLLPLNARLLPRITQVTPVGPMLLGDAGVHAITLHPDDKTARSYVAMPLSPVAMVVFGDQLVGDEEVLDLARLLNTKIAMESTVVVDTPEASIIKGFVEEMWSHQLEPSGTGLPKAVHVWSRIEDIPDSRSRAAEAKPSET